MKKRAERQSAVCGDWLSKALSRTCWRLPAVRRELMIIGPLISKNVLGGGLLFICPGSPEGKSRGECGHQYSRAAYPWALECWERGYRVRFSHSFAIPIPELLSQQSGNVSHRTKLEKEKLPNAHTEYNE